MSRINIVILFASDRHHKQSSGWSAILHSRISSSSSVQLSVSSLRLFWREKNLARPTCPDLSFPPIIIQNILQLMINSRWARSFDAIIRHGRRTRAHWRFSLWSSPTLRRVQNAGSLEFVEQTHRPLHHILAMGSVPNNTVSLRRPWAPASSGKRPR